MLVMDWAWTRHSKNGVGSGNWSIADWEMLKN